MNQQDKQAFIEMIAGLVMKYPSPVSNSVRIAQACLESAYGTSDLAEMAHNLFGIKASDPWTGKTFSKYSYEYVQCEKKLIESPFRLYESWEESVKDHADFFESTEYRKKYYTKVINAKTIRDQVNGLQGTYATDIYYAQKLMDIINSFNLQQYDITKEDNTMAKRTFKDVAKQVYGTEVINWDGFKNIGAPRRSGSPEGVIIHNDYGAANGKGYISWLKGARIPNPVGGYAHYYIDRLFAMRAVPTYKGAWHAGDYGRGNYTGHGKPANYGNMKLIGYEVNQSRHFVTTNRQFRLNEEVVFMQVAEDLLFYGLKANRGTVWLHNEFTGTSCPHRSWELHVGVGAPYNHANRMKLKDYFIKRVQYWMDVLEGELPVPVKNYLPEEHKEVSKPIDKEVKTYTVKKGDFLYKIGEMFGVDWKDIKKWNHLKTNVLSVGQELVVRPDVYNPKVEKPVETGGNDNTPVVKPEVIDNVSGDEKTPAIKLKDNQLLMPSGKVIEWKILDK